jgi:hypothetical protein
LPLYINILLYNKMSSKKATPSTQKINQKLASSSSPDLSDKKKEYINMLNEEHE